MGNRRFEMYEYRQVLVRMRLGDTDRALARAGLMGRRKAAELRAVASEEGWLDRDLPLPDEATLAARVRRPSMRPSTTSAIEPYREAIHDFLVRRHGFAGSYSSLRSSLQAHTARHPQATIMLDFEPGDAAQVDFGRGPVLKHRDERPRRPRQGVEVIQRDDEFLVVPGEVPDDAALLA